MLSEFGRMPMLGGNEASFGDELEKEVASLLREQRRQEDNDRERELNIHRYGSAPPTVEGSLNAEGMLFGNGGGARLLGFSGAKNGKSFVTEEAVRSDPAYLSYYYSNVNLNPRLPPPLISKENWRFAQRIKGGPSLGGIGDTRKLNRPDNGASRPSFSTPPGFDSTREDSLPEKVHGSGEWGANDLIGLSGLGIVNKQKSIAEIFQDDMVPPASVNGFPSRPSSRNAFDDNFDTSRIAKVDANQNTAPPSYTYAAALGASLSRSNTPDPQVLARAPSPCPTPIGAGRVGTAEKRQVAAPIAFSVVSGSADDSADVVAALSALNLPKDSINNEERRVQRQIEQSVENHHDSFYGIHGDENHDLSAYITKTESGGHIDVAPYLSDVKYIDVGKNGVQRSDFRKPNFIIDGQDEHQISPPATRSAYLKGLPTSILNGVAGYPSKYQHLEGSASSSPNSRLNGFSIDHPLASMMVGQVGTGSLPPFYENAASASALGIPGLDTLMLGGGITGTGSGANVVNRITNNPGEAPFMDPLYMQYLTASDYASAHFGAHNGRTADHSYMDNSYINMLEMQNAYLGALLSPDKPHYSTAFGGKSRGSDHRSYPGNHASIAGFSYPGSPSAGSVMPRSPAVPASPMRHADLMRFSSGMRNFSGSKMGGWHLDSGYSVNDVFASSLLEEFKSNKAKCFELSDIAGHVVEFSADQYGSRFIQQKLETATTAEKTMVYQEIMSQALALMTDVFGNYVVQKFFEHGLASQRRELANKLFGHVLTLSLQMYGCRVIQKVIEVVDLDQKIKMVEELEGHVMRCVRDQNGNHVIQKCIECVPEDNIHFIISTFFDQIATLSTHPYGCRVVQRVLEHCKSPETLRKVMEEILGSVSNLAQDQYGNYVVQHVLEHGEPHERFVIIEELAGKIVSMSQQKFASNVIEKCLTFGGPAERELMVNEMLGTTDENEPLQAMMKDQFGNYVVQKVLETCEDQHRELILSRVKVHLNALKKYTYGKHIVARVEKLVATGERRIAARLLQQTMVA
ncbi:hypothetical protein MLD38_002283 [Melastoma candidum]|uniref:Uncharacterized protein n=1 Tax=Melastoma candidum TaxID=119954 RepID=A0ACB9SGY0_9MYRT|nr:hypothetical protein MLD38_002283 [Melastoma candidum]